jgi:asparaginyl-tRNA synthetase
MDATSIARIGQKTGSAATVRGWLYNKRSSGKLQFLIVRDGTGYLQCVVPKAEVAPDVWEAAEKATQECSLSVTGTVRADNRAPGGFEMSATQVRILGPSENYPISPKEHGVDFLMSQRHLWMRSAQQHAVLRVRSEVEQTIRDFFYEREYTLIDSPAKRPTSRSPASSTSSRPPRPSERSIASGPRFARRSPRRAGT